ncbi:MAG: helix-turn-helix domain-containing protein [Prochlorotrichaceae cyanobacterium]|jgi:cytoskeletal protein RodZ
MDMAKHWQPDQEAQLREVGIYLQQQRQARDLTIEAVSEKTRIRSGLIMALEAGHLEELPEPIYLQGFVKRYAEFLGLDSHAVAVSVPTPLVKLPQTSGEPPIRFHTPSGKSPLGLSSNLITGVGIMALLLGMLAGFQVWSKGQQNLAESLEPIEATPLPTVAPTPIPQSLDFYLEATAETWLEVTIDGEVVLSEIVAPGFSKTWTVKEKVGLYVARSEAVKIGINGANPQVFGAGGEKEASFPVVKPAQ